MTENINVGDIMAMYDTQSTKKAGSTLSTVLGVIGAIIVLALLWNAYTRARDTRANTEAIASGTLGSLTSAVNGTQEEIRVLKSYERADALKLAYTDGALGIGYCGVGYGPGWGHRGHHGHDDCGCGQKQQFREVRTFAETADNIEVINTCGPRV